MLASLRPLSPPGLDSRHRSQLPTPIYRNHRTSDDETHQFSALQMKGLDAERHTPPPPSRAGPTTQQLEQGSNSYDSMDQRLSPRSRQRSWHHPYMQPTRNAFGPSPPVPLDAVAGSSSRAYEHGTGIYAGHVAEPKHRSPPNRYELLHAAAHETRHRAGSRGDIYERAQPLNILPRSAAHPQDVERVGSIGPSRHRGRSNTLSFPHPDTTRLRAGSLIGNRRHSPSIGAHSGYDEPIPPPPRSWDDSRTMTFPSQAAAANALNARRLSPTSRPSSRHSPILFAPLSPRQEPLLQVPISRAAGQMPFKFANPSGASRGQHYRSRPGTPVSPLNIDSLSMEDTALPSASGMAVPAAAGQQRSPLVGRGRNDYFASSSAEWGRSGTLAAERSGSPQFSHGADGLRRSSRDHPYRGAGLPHPEDLNPGDAELPRYHSSSHPVAHPSPQSGRDSIHSLSTHPLRTADLLERERFAMSQHHAHSQAGFPGPSGMHEYGYNSEFAPQQGRAGPAGSFPGYPPQHVVPVDRIAHSRRRRRPPYSYSSMITQAIASSPEGRMTLREIYTWICSNFSGYPMSGPDSQGWQNTVRHNLSLGKIFIKKARTAQDIYDSCSSGNPSQSQAARGKGGWWTLHPVVLSQIRSGQRTHNDEFDDIERLVEIENASTAEAPAPLLVKTSSSASADEASDLRRSSGEKTLTRQRSYSDSKDSTVADQHRPSSSHQASIAPVSRKASIDASRLGPLRAMLASTTADYSSDQDMPSVLQRTFEDEEPPSTYNRMRGHTIAMHETPLRYEAGQLGGQHYVLTRPSPGSVSIPRPFYQPQTAEDVSMETLPRDSSMVLQEARETLVSAQQEQEQEQGQRRLHDQREARTAAAESPEVAGRMAIRGLLNS